MFFLNTQSYLDTKIYYLYHQCRKFKQITKSKDEFTIKPVKQVRLHVGENSMTRQYNLVERSILAGITMKERLDENFGDCKSFGRMFSSLFLESKSLQQMKRRIELGLKRLERIKRFRSGKSYDNIHIEISLLDFYSYLQVVSLCMLHECSVKKLYYFVGNKKLNYNLYMDKKRVHKFQQALACRKEINATNNGWRKIKSMDPHYDVALKEQSQFLSHLCIVNHHSMITMDDDKLPLSTNGARDLGLTVMRVEGRKPSPVMHSLVVVPFGIPVSSYMMKNGDTKEDVQKKLLARTSHTNYYSDVKHPGVIGASDRYYDTEIFANCGMDFLGTLAERKNTIFKKCKGKLKLDSDSERPFDQALQPINASTNTYLYETTGYASTYFAEKNGTNGKKSEKVVACRTGDGKAVTLISNFINAGDFVLQPKSIKFYDYTKKFSDFNDDNESDNDESSSESSEPDTDAYAHGDDTDYSDFENNADSIDADTENRYYAFINFFQSNNPTANEDDHLKVKPKLKNANINIVNENSEDRENQNDNGESENDAADISNKDALFFCQKIFENDDKKLAYDNIDEVLRLPLNNIKQITVTQCEPAWFATRPFTVTSSTACGILRFVNFSPMETDSNPGSGSLSGSRLSELVKYIKFMVGIRQKEPVSESQDVASSTLESENDIIQKFLECWFMKPLKKKRSLRIGSENEIYALQHLHGHIAQCTDNLKIIKIIQNGLVSNKKCQSMTDSADGICVIQIEYGNQLRLEPALIEVKTATTEKAKSVHESICLDHGSEHIEINLPCDIAKFHKFIPEQRYRCQVLHHAAVYQIPNVVYVVAEEGQIIRTVFLRINKKLRLVYKQIIEFIQKKYLYWIYDSSNLNEPDLEKIFAYLDFGSLHVRDSQTVTIRYRLWKKLHEWINKNNQPLPETYKLIPLIIAVWNRLKVGIDSNTQIRSHVKGDFHAPVETSLWYIFWQNSCLAASKMHQNYVNISKVDPNKAHNLTKFRKILTPEPFWIYMEKVATILEEKILEINESNSEPTQPIQISFKEKWGNGQFETKKISVVTNSMVDKYKDRSHKATFTSFNSDKDLIRFRLFHHGDHKPAVLSEKRVKCVMCTKQPKYGCFLCKVHLCCNPVPNGTSCFHTFHNTEVLVKRGKESNSNPSPVTPSTNKNSNPRRRSKSSNRRNKNRSSQSTSKSSSSSSRSASIATPINLSSRMTRSRGSARRS